jgi:hypothetical protein
MVWTPQQENIPSPGDVVINEYIPNATPEYVELYNTKNKVKSNYNTSVTNVDHLYYYIRLSIYHSVK